MPPIRLVQAAAVWLAVAALGFRQDAPAMKATIKLVSGEVTTGTAGMVPDGSLSLTIDYGPVRDPWDKISMESKARLGISSAAANIGVMAAMIRKFEDLVENAVLRRATSAPPIQPAFGCAGILGYSGVQSKTDASVGGGSESLGSCRMSTTWKRHNSNCRYFGGKGRACGPNDGVAYNLLFWHNNSLSYERL